MLLTDTGKVLSSHATTAVTSTLTASTQNPTVFVFTGHQDRPVVSIAWSPDGKSLASGGLDNTLRIWNTTTTVHKFISLGQSGSVEGVSWSPDGTYIVAANGEDTVEVFNAQTGSLVYTYSRSSEGFHTVVWSPDGKYLASASRSVQVWSAPRK